MVAHLQSLFSEDRIAYLSIDWMKQLPRYIKGEARRWERLLARGGEAPQVFRELREWELRTRGLESQVAAELRWLPLLEDLRLWLEEYRVSLYAQEIRTLGPISAARLAARASAVAAWVTR